MALSITDYLGRGPATSREIQSATGLNQRAVSRQLSSIGQSIIRLQDGRSPRYALTRTAFGADDKLPLYMVDEHGNNAAVAVLRPLAHGGFFVEPLTGMPSVLLGASGTGLYPDLPYFLYDLAPQGFMGRLIARELSSQSDDFPDDPRLWNVDHIGRYLISNGDDLPGNFKFGHQAHLRVRHKPVPITPDEYPALADSTMSGNIPGSSAGGEQPKFTAFSGDRSAHVIVKFTPKGDNPVARRWRDILITEHHATEAIRERSYPAAETRLLDGGARLFLESQRFDRSGEYGRMSMISLLYVDAAFAGEGKGWYRAMSALLRENLVSGQHCHDAAVLECFGLLINNTDMHLGNMSLAIDGGVFRILPAYDMCSMGFAPMSGEVPPFEFSPRAAATQQFSEAIVGAATIMAHDHWSRVANDSRISDEFREYLAQGNPIDRMQ